MKLNQQKQKSAGFTLIELLIVIIIIGILAAIGFVAYSGSQNKAKKSSAESTVSQVRSKLAEYNATNGTYPADEAALEAYLRSPEGGNNASMADTLDENNDAYVYTSPTGNASYELTAKASLWNGAATEDITVTN